MNEEETKLQLFEEVSNLCLKVLKNKKSVNLEEKQEISGKIEVFIMKFKNNQHCDLAKQFVKDSVLQIKKFLDQEIIPSFNNVNNSSYQILSNFLQCYERYDDSLKSIKIILYCTANIIQQEESAVFFQSLGDSVFVKEFSELMQKQIFPAIVELIDNASKSSDNLDISKISDLICKCGVKISQLQQSIEETETFKLEQEFKQKIFEYFEEKYQQNYREWQRDYESPEYLKKVQHEKNINERILKFTDKTILAEVNKILNSHLLTQYKSYLLSESNKNNFEQLLKLYMKQQKLYNENQQQQYSFSEQNKYQSILQLVGDLYGNLDDHYEQISTNFKNIITEEGKQIVDNKNKQIIESNGDFHFSDQEFIINFHNLYDRYFQLIQKCFTIKSDFIMALNNAFESFINEPVGNCEFADYLVAFINDQIDVIRQSKSSQIQMEAVVKLFVFINHKERFIKLYKASLAQRLLKQLRQNDSRKQKQGCLIEQNAIEEMEKKCGTQDLESLRMMIKDCQKIENEAQKLTDNNIQLNIQTPIILCKQNWPEIDEWSCEPAISQIITSQKKIFQQNFQPKSLIWLDIVSGVEILWNERSITYNLSIPQAIILLQFNYINRALSVQDIGQRTGLKEQYVVQNCRILKNHKILIEVFENDNICYFFNEEQAKSKKGGSKKKIVTETYVPTNNVEQIQSVYDKDLAIEAAIVKIMKKAKEMQHSDLVIKVQAYMKNQQNVEIPFQQIKTLIEKLQKNEYLERDSNNYQLIKYK